MSAILKFDLKNRKQLRFSEVNYLNKLHKKRQNFACDNYIFPKTRGNKNKQWTHSTLVKFLVIVYKCVNNAYQVAGPRLWNFLPPNMRQAKSLDIFKGQLKTHLFN